MRIGSKVYCVKDHIDHMDHMHMIPTHIKDNHYIIDDIINDEIIALSSELSYNFAFTTKKDSILTEYFYEYFITEKEHRKLKLEKINERRR